MLTKGGEKGKNDFVYMSIFPGVTDSCEACGCQEPNPGLLQEPQELLTTEQLLQHLLVYFLISVQNTRFQLCGGGACL